LRFINICSGRSDLFLLTIQKNLLQKLENWFIVDRLFSAGKYVDHWCFFNLYQTANFANTLWTIR